MAQEEPQVSRCRRVWLRISAHHFLFGGQRQPWSDPLGCGQDLHLDGLDRLLDNGPVGDHLSRPICTCDGTELESAATRHLRRCAVHVDPLGGRTGLGWSETRIDALCVVVSVRGVPRLVLLS